MSYSDCRIVVLQRVASRKSDDHFRAWDWDINAHWVKTLPASSRGKSPRVILSDWKVRYGIILSNLIIETVDQQSRQAWRLVKNGQHKDENFLGK